MGQEIGLSKFGLDNTYNVKTVNNMDWKLVEKRSELVNYMADLIKVRRLHDIFKITDKDDIVKIFDAFQLENGMLTIAIRDEKYLDNHKKGLMLINPTDKVKPVELDEYFKEYLSTGGLTTKEIITKHYSSPDSSLVIFLLD